MVEQTTAAAGTAEPQPSFVKEVETEVEHIGSEIKTGAEDVVDRLFGTGTSAKAEAAVATAVTVAKDVAGAAVATLTALGAAHLNLSQLSLTQELVTVKAQIEDGIVALARHIAGAGA